MDFALLFAKNDVQLTCIMRVHWNRNQSTLC